MTLRRRSSVASSVVIPIDHEQQKSAVAARPLRRTTALIARRHVPQPSGTITTAQTHNQLLSRELLSDRQSDSPSVLIRRKATAPGHVPSASQFRTTSLRSRSRPTRQTCAR
jgi:hypothetical protein